MNHRTTQGCSASLSYHNQHLTEESKNPFSKIIHFHQSFSPKCPRKPNLTSFFFKWETTALFTLYFASELQYKGTTTTKKNFKMKDFAEPGWKINDIDQGFRFGVDIVWRSCTTENLHTTNGVCVKTELLLLVISEANKMWVQKANNDLGECWISDRRRWGWYSFYELRRSFLLPANELK